MARVKLWLLEQKFGRLTVVGETGKTHCSGSAIWLCECVCGNRVEVPTRYLRSGGTTSCGCFRRERLRVTGKDHPAFKHGHTPAGGKFSPTYTSYQAMLSRCHYPGSYGFPSYGAKGVWVCLRWIEGGFSAFLEDLGPRPEGMTIDRINPFGNYTPENCKWSTREEQDANKRNNHESVDDCLLAGMDVF